MFVILFCLHRKREQREARPLDQKEKKRIKTRNTARAEERCYGRKILNLKYN